MIPLFRPSIGDREIAAVAEVLRSGWLGLGPKTQAFEEAFAGWVGAEHAVGANSATAALHLSVAALGIGPGDEVLVPAISFVSTSHAIEYTGARPVFVDVDPDTLCMDLDDAEKKLGPRTRAIVPVHFGGRPCDMERLGRLCAERDLFLIEDAAHACGAESGGRRIGSGARPFVCFSFHAVKNLTCGEGGMITTDDAELARRLRELRWMGITRDTWDRTANATVYAWQYWVDSLGFKYHLSDIAAALGLVQLERLPELNHRRREIVAGYREAFGSLDWLRLPPLPAPDTLHAWHLFYVRTQERDKMIAHLKKHGVSPGVHYYPLHLHPYYRRKYPDVSCPVSEEVWKELLTLPLFPDLSEHELARIHSSVRSFGGYLEWKRSRLEGGECVLREVESSDLDRLRAWRDAPEIRRWFFDASPVSAEQQLAWFNRYLADEGDVLYVIEADGRPVGTIGLASIDRRQGTAELGRMLIEASARRRGWARQAVRILLEYAFGTVGLHRVYCEVHEENVAARALYRDCGFVEEGVLRAALVVDGRRTNKVVLAALSR